jgi:site-specific DNA-methyltransferase (adenine-specific)
VTPYYDHAGITIYHGDCRDILPSIEPVDLVLTDPPYGVEKGYESYADTPDSLQTLISDTWPLILKKADKIMVTSGIGNIWKYPPAKWVLCWNKPNAMTRSCVSNANIWEPILIYGIKGNSFGVDAVTVSISPQNNGHPCPKPLRLFEWLISKACLCGTVCDPFMGSGTTLIAAKNLMHRAIGIEIEEKYCEIAVRRLQQEVLPL